MGRVQRWQGVEPTPAVDMKDMLFETPQVQHCWCTQATPPQDSVCSATALVFSTLLTTGNASLTAAAEADACLMPLVNKLHLSVSWSYTVNMLPVLCFLLIAGCCC